jgi:hypothetical protein
MSELVVDCLRFLPRPFILGVGKVRVRPMLE